MTATKKAKGARFDVAMLRELAGDKVFERGEDYFEDGEVEILALEPGRVLAQVSGSQDYRTELRARGKSIGGHCSCPAYTDWGFCKHMVAAGLAANAAGDGDERGGALARIRAHLQAQGVDALAGMIVALAERDSRLFRKLELAATASHGDDPALEPRLRKAIDGATRTGRYIDYASASDWAAGVDAALDAVEALASGPRAEIALKLVEWAIARIDEATGSIDDSDGHCGALLNRAQEIHVAAVAAVRPDPVALARKLFAREIDDGYDIFWGVAPRYAEALGERGLAEYRRLAQAAWEKLPPRTPSRATPETAGDVDRLLNILDFFAERDGDVDARIELRARDLSSSYRYLQLAEFCRAHGRTNDAVRYAEEGLWIFEDGRPDEPLVLLAADLMDKAGRRADAEALLWRTFDKRPTLALYERLRKLGGAVARDRAVQSLESLCAQAGRGGGRPISSSRSFRTRRRSTWPGRRCANSADRST
jgi:hypothetical protein